MNTEQGKWRVYKELRADLFSTAAMNPFPGHTSSSRIQMFASSHLSQKLNIAEPTLRYMQTGMEYEFGKYTLSVSMPCDASIIRVIPRYSETLDENSIPDNPQDIVIYEDVETHEIGILDIPKFKSYHQHFGFEYVKAQGYDMIAPKAFIPKDTIIVDAPSKLPNGGYMYGRELNVAFMSHPAIAEDGIMICRDVLEKFAYKTRESRVVEWGSRQFPINIYGTVDNFKAFPDIGDVIGPDGILMCFRRLDKTLGPVEQSIYDMMIPDDISDRIVYAPPGGKIVDIIVQCGEECGLNTLEGTDAQIFKYANATKVFYDKILKEYHRLKSERKNNLKISKEFHRLLVEAQANTTTLSNPKLTKLYKKSPLDDFRVEFVIEYTNIPREGAKLTDCVGGKGVVCYVAEPHEMPVDKNGVRADAVVDGGATINRSNYGRFFEHYINAVSREILIKFRRTLGILPNEKYIRHKVEECYHNDLAQFTRLWNELMAYYDVIQPLVYDDFLSITDEGKIQHLGYILNNDFQAIHLFTPTDNPVSYSHAIEELEKRYKPLRDKVSYVYEGKHVESADPVRISSIYMMLLEKTGDDWSATASGKLQVFGFLAQTGKADKHSTPIRNQPVRTWGEAENRLIVSYTSPECAAEIADRNNNPSTSKEIVRRIIKDKYPTNIDKLVDRQQNPYGGSKPLQTLKHVALCAGWKLKYTPDQHYK